MKMKIFDFFKFSQVLAYRNFSGFSLARYLFFSWSSRLQKLKLQHRLRWGNIILDNSDVQISPKKLREHAQVTTTCFDKDVRIAAFGVLLWAVEQSSITALRPILICFFWVLCLAPRKFGALKRTWAQALNSAQGGIRGPRGALQGQGPSC